MTLRSTREMAAVIGSLATAIGEAKSAFTELAEVYH